MFAPEENLMLQSRIRTLGELLGSNSLDSDIFRDDLSDLISELSVAPSHQGAIALARYTDGIVLLDRLNRDPKLFPFGRKIADVVSCDIEIGNIYFAFQMTHEYEQAQLFITAAMFDLEALASNPGLFNLIDPICQRTLDLGTPDYVLDENDIMVVELLEGFASDPDFTRAFNQNLRRDAIDCSYETLHNRVEYPEVKARIESAYTAVREFSGTSPLLNPSSIDRSH